MVSIYPCDAHGRRVPDRLDTAYFTLSRGTTRRTRRMRLCGECLDHLFETVGEDWVSVGLEDTGPLAEMCATCKEANDLRGESWGLFITTYKRGDDRQDYFAWYCGTCADDLARVLELKET